MHALGWKASAPVNGNYQKPVPFNPPPATPPEATYQYANGNRKLKWRTPEKRVLWRHEDGSWGKKGEPGLYRIDEAALVAAQGGVVHASESESDVDAMAGLGLAAIATHAGASSPWREFPAALAGAKIVVWEHQDEPGRKYAAAMQDVACLAGVDAAIARPQEPHKDVRDWILAGATRSDLDAAADAAFWDDVPSAEPADELLVAELPPPEYVINPIAIRENLTLIQGEPKAGKSVITLYLAICAALGMWTADRWSVPKAVRVLYITWEDGRRRIQKRMKQILLGLGEPFKDIGVIPNLFYFTKSKGKFKAPRIRLEDAAGKLLLGKLIRKHRADLVVCDTLSHMKAVDENSVEKMQPVMDALTDLVEETGAAVIVNHHTGKEGKNSGKSTTYRSRGSSVIPAAPDIILHLGDRGKTNLTPCHLISREDDGDSFVLEYHQEGKEVIRFKLVDEAEEGEKDAPTDETNYAVRKRIIENLAELCTVDPWGATRNTVAKVCKVSYTTASRHLAQLTDEGSVQEREIETKNGPTRRYAPTTHVWPEGPKMGGK